MTAEGPPDQDAFRGKPEDYRPARGYSWPPFEAGNTAAMRHGAKSARRYGPIAEALVVSILDSADYLQAPKYRAAVEALAVTEARLRLLDEWLAEHGLLDKHGKPQGCMGLALRLERLALEQRSQLGLTPSSAARLGRNVAGATFDLARLWMEQDEAARAAEAAQDGSEAAE